jgi:DNA-binding GntR family transcriptional regulator
MHEDTAMKDTTKRQAAAPRGGRASMLSPERRQDLIASIRRYLSEAPASGAKHTRLQNAILSAISDGVLNAGDQLPPEPEIAEGSGLSLGTVRRCLTHLATDGVVSRQHGRGTFVSGVTLTENEVWHMRFLEDDLKTVRPIYQRILSRDLVRVQGDWSTHLGPSDSGYIRVQRAVNVDSLLICHSDFYLSGDVFMGVMDMDPHEIESVGLKHVLKLRFGIPLVRVLKTSQLLPTPKAIGTVIRVEPGQVAQRIEVRGFSHENRPVSYQVVWIPPTDIPMDISGPSHFADTGKS